MKRFALFLTLLFGMISWHADAQYINSPYSGSGIGDLSFQGLPSNFSMGEVGIGTPSIWHINLQNPALLVNNLFSTYQVGLNADFRKFTKTDATDQSASLGLRTLAMSFPVISKARWVTSFALLPYSNVKYNTFAQDTIGNSLSTTSFQGDGGIVELAWSNGFKINKSLSLGFRASYVFGEINEASVVNFTDNTDFLFNYGVSYEENSTYSNLTLGFGAAYNFTISDTRILHFGATYQLDTEFSGTRNALYRRNGLIQSTLSTSRLQYDVPYKLGLGLSYEQSNVFKIGFDFETQDWAQSASEGPGESFRRYTKLALGGEYIPDYQSINSYLKRATYRVGLNFTESPYLLNYAIVNDFGINFGASFPMSGISSLDTGFKIGVRGTTKNDLVRENYFQVVLGATINDRWFIKRKYD